MRNAMKPDSGETGPSHLGRTMNRRTNNPAMEMAAETYRDVINGDQGEGAETPKNKGVRKSGEGSLKDDFPLCRHLPYELAYARAEWSQRKIGSATGVQNYMQNF